ncbi:MAG: hypothetical protein ACTSWW_09360 [Promethearchaeota archaeon]
MMRKVSAEYISKINQLQALQQQVKYWEKTSDNYKGACDVFRKYLDCLQTFQDPKALVNGYIRMAGYCERMDDPFLSQDLYKEAVELCIRFGLASSSHIQNLRSKIKSLEYFY